MDWRVKVAVQWTVARLPGGWRINHHLQDLRDRNPRPALRRRILARAAEISWAERHGMQFEGADLLEIGTGRTPIPTMLMGLLGPASLRTLDRRRLLDPSRISLIAEEFLDLADNLAEILGRPAAVIAERARVIREARTIEAALSSVSILYEAPADATETGLPDHCLDGMVSFDVMEHLPAATLERFNSEARRVLRRDGRQFHAIGLGDHYAPGDPRITSVNFLRFSDRTWDFLAGHHLSYHNRLRMPEFLDAFERFGFVPVAIDREVDPPGLAALRTQRVADRFRTMAPEELAVHRARLLLRFGDDARSVTKGLDKDRPS